MKYLSLFSGIGGFELGIGKKSECIGYSEIDKYAIQIYEKHFNHKNYGNIEKINPKGLPDFELLVGGFPCQAFSIAGKRMGFEDTRGTLFFEIARIIREKQPRLLLLENVKGLLSHDKGRTFFTIIASLNELGYDCQWEVLNSKDFGVPQNRERVFIVGHLRGTPRPEVFPIGKSYEKSTGKADLKGCSNTLTGRSAGGGNRRGNYIQQLNNPKHSNDRVYSPKGISPTLNTMQGGRRQPIIKPVLTPERPKKRQAGRRFKEDGDPAFTLTARDIHGVCYNDKIRRLTPKECERLQGFPDDWTKEGYIRTRDYPEYIVEKISDTQRYKTLGNAVTVNVVREIIKKLIK